MASPIPTRPSCKPSNGFTSPSPGLRGHRVAAAAAAMNNSLSTPQRTTETSVEQMTFPTALPVERTLLQEDVSPQPNYNQQGTTPQPADGLQTTPRTAMRASRRKITDRFGPVEHQTSPVQVPASVAASISALQNPPSAPVNPYQQVTMFCPSILGASPIPKSGRDMLPPALSAAVTPMRAAHDDSIGKVFPTHAATPQAALVDTPAPATAETVPKTYDQHAFGTMENDAYFTSVSPPKEVSFFELDSKPSAAVAPSQFTPVKTAVIVSEAVDLSPADRAIRDAIRTSPAKNGKTGDSCLVNGHFFASPEQMAGHSNSLLKRRHMQRILEATFENPDIMKVPTPARKTGALADITNVNRNQQNNKQQCCFTPKPPPRPQSQQHVVAH